MQCGTMFSSWREFTMMILTTRPWKSISHHLSVPILETLCVVLRTSPGKASRAWLALRSQKEFTFVLSWWRQGFKQEYPTLWKQYEVEEQRERRRQRSSSSKSEGCLRVKLIQCFNCYLFRLFYSLSCTEMGDVLKFWNISDQFSLSEITITTSVFSRDQHHFIVFHLRIVIHNHPHPFHQKFSKVVSFIQSDPVVPIF